MKELESGVDYDRYLVPNPDGPLEPWIIHDDAPDWAKEAFESDKKIYTDNHGDGYF